MKVLYLLVYALAAAIEFLAQWAKERAGKALKEPAEPVPPAD